MRTIDFSTHTPEQVMRMAEQALQDKLPAWENEVWRFLKDWLGPDPYIVAHTSGSTGKTEIDSTREKKDAGKCIYDR